MREKEKIKLLQKNLKLAFPFKKIKVSYINAENQPGWQGFFQRYVYGNHMISIDTNVDYDEFKKYLQGVTRNIYIFKKDNVDFGFPFIFGRKIFGWDTPVECIEINNL